MSKEKQEKIQINPAMIDKEELMNLFNKITDNLLQMESYREMNNDLVKEIKDSFGFKPSAIRAAASAMYKRKREELEEKQEEIFTILNLVESAKRRSSSDTSDL
jgi:hypothetical protein